MSDLNISNVFLPNGSLFLEQTLKLFSCKERFVVVLFEKIEDRDMPDSKFLLVKIIFFTFLYLIKMLTRWTRIRWYPAPKEVRYFVRKRLRKRYRKEKMCILGHLYLLSLLQEEKEQTFGNELFSVELINSNNLRWQSYLSYYSICFHSSQKKQGYFRNAVVYAWIMLLLAGDIELNPGPMFNYSLSHPNLCGYYRAAIFFVFTGRKLIHRKDKDGNDIIEDVDIEEGFLDMKNIFSEHYEANSLEFKKLKKILPDF